MNKPTDTQTPVETEGGVPVAPAAPAQHSPLMRIGCSVLFVALLVLGGFLIHRAVTTPPGGQANSQGGGRGGRGGGTGGPQPVKVAKVTTADVPVNLQAVGNLAAYTTVPVTAQVAGQLVHVYFKQGDFVHKGQPLFAIDPRSFQATLSQTQANQSRDTALLGQAQSTYAQAQANLQKDAAAVQQAQANLQRDLAQQQFAQSEERRYGTLVSQGYVTQEQYEQQKANSQAFAGTIAADRAAVATAQATLNADRQTATGILSTIQADRATIQADQAAIDNANIQLGYTYINAPMSGRTGALNSFEGAVIGANGATPLVTIDQITPIYVSFAIPEKYLQDVRNARLGSVPVTINLGGGEPPETGHVVFVDQAVDATTGTIQLRSEFPNTRHRLWPGQFVTVQVLLKHLQHAIVVPSQAVQPGQQGQYVFVVKPDNTVESRTVEVVQSNSDATVVKSGVTPGETVVTDGQLQLTTGSKVEIVTGDYAPPRPESSGSPGTGHHHWQTPSPEASGSPEAPGSPDASPAPDASASPGQHHHHHRHQQDSSSSTP